MRPKGQEWGRQNSNNILAASKLKNAWLLTSETREAGRRPGPGKNLSIISGASESGAAGGVKNRKVISNMKKRQLESSLSLLVQPGTQFH